MSKVSCSGEYSTLLKLFVFVLAFEFKLRNLAIENKINRAAIRNVSKETPKTRKCVQLLRGTVSTTNVVAEVHTKPASSRFRGGTQLVQLVALVMHVAHLLLSHRTHRSSAALWYVPAGHLDTHSPFKCV